MPFKIIRLGDEIAGQVTRWELRETERPGQRGQDTDAAVGAVQGCKELLRSALKGWKGDGRSKGTLCPPVGDGKMRVQETDLLGWGLAA